MRRFGLAFGVIALTAAALVVGLVSAGAAPRSPRQAVAFPNGGGDGGLVERGHELFLTGCSSCHGVDGEGTDQAPGLVGVGAASADFQLSTGRMPNTEPNRQAVPKPPAYDREEIDALVAYVASLGDGPAIPDIDDPPGDLVGGGRLFTLNCAACHSSAGNGGALSSGRNAPTLHGATRVQVAEAIRTGPGPMPVFGPETLSDKQVNSIVEYVHYLRDPEDPGGLDLGLVGPITEGLVALLFGLVVLAFVCKWIEPKEQEE
ncbi:MAG: cytochrome bc1 complex diheme cytochrome c subunit [Acidimicrobiia bacterium]